MNKRIQKKLHKRVIINSRYLSPEEGSKSELRYLRLFLARGRSRSNEYRQIQKRARRKVGQERKERQNVSDERTKAIVDKLVDVEVKIREVFENV